MLEEWIRRIGLRRKIDEVLNFQWVVTSLVISEISKNNILYAKVRTHEASDGL
jgi:hypothetical protein